MVEAARTDKTATEVVEAALMVVVVEEAVVMGVVAEEVAVRGGGGRGGGGAGYERDTSMDNSNIDVGAVEGLIADRSQARRVGDFDRADALRDQLLQDFGVQVWDRDRVWRSGCSASGSGRPPQRGGGDRFGGGRWWRSLWRGTPIAASQGFWTHRS